MMQQSKKKFITDKCQAFIEALLKNDDNKYCVDCDAKGPRWASWNLGVFLCIRCAGIHRNLGVHISRVKSVNLDAWTPEHVAYMQRMGNSQARAIYEANLPADFRRPQTDAALETFIRAKYEHKKYMATDYVDPGPPEPVTIEKMEKKKSKPTSSGRSIELAVPPQSLLSATSITTNTSGASATSAATTNHSKSSNSALLLDLDPVVENSAPQLGPLADVTSSETGVSANINALSGGLDLLADLAAPARPPAPLQHANFALEPKPTGVEFGSTNLTENKGSDAKDYILSLYNKR